MAEQYLQLILVLQLSLAHVLVLSLAQNQSSEFISIDCGYLDKPSYRDGKSHIDYTSDAKRIDSGVRRSILPEYKANNSFDQQFWNVRSFPDGTRNCYSFNDLPGSGDSSLQYLIRARFMYGNYDGLNSPPKFDIHLGTILWDTVEFDHQNPHASIITKEIIYNPVLYYIHVCLLNTGNGTPFISVLEIRPIHGYQNDEQKSLGLISRFDLGSQDGKAVRYPDDVYDRIWTPYGYGSGDLKNMSTSLPINEEKFASDPSIPPAPPYTVMRTAASPANDNGNLTIPIPPRYIGSTFSIMLYLAELQNPPPNPPRLLEFYEGTNFPPSTFNISYLLGVYDTSEVSGLDVPQVWISTPSGSTLPPIGNAIEIFAQRDIPPSETDRPDTEAIMHIKKTYKIKKIGKEILVTRSVTDGRVSIAAMKDLVDSE